MPSDGADDVDGGVGIGAPAGMDGQRTPSGTGTEPVADEFIIDKQRANGALLVGRPVTVGHQGAVSDAHRGQGQHRTQLDGEAGPARVIGSGGIDQQDVECDW